MVYMVLIANECSALAPGFFLQTDFADNHVPVDGFTHIVNRQGGDRHRCQRLHLNPGPAGNLGCDVDADDSA